MVNQLRVLLIEDNALEGMGLQCCVNDLGHKVVFIASCPEEAIKFSKEDEFDFVFIDINLAGENGIETMAEILKYHDVPFVFVTGYSDAATIKRASQLFPYGYLIKPVDINDIRSVITIAGSMLQFRTES